MTATRIEARDQMFELLFEAWNAKSSDIVGYVPELRWQGRMDPAVPDASKIWGRVSLQTVLDGQSVMSPCEGAPGQRRYTVSGLLFVQLFIPRANVSDYEKGGMLADLVQAAFRGKTTSGGVFFTNVRILPLVPEDSYERINIVTEYDYDELA